MFSFNSLNNPSTETARPCLKKTKKWTKIQNLSCDLELHFQVIFLGGSGRRGYVVEARGKIFTKF